jgi:hypothetical protein
MPGPLTYWLEVDFIYSVNRFLQLLLKSEKTHNKRIMHSDKIKPRRFALQFCFSSDAGRYVNLAGEGK